MSIYLLIILLSLLVFHVYLRYSRTGRLFHLVPGPPSIPLLGNILKVDINTSPATLWKHFQIFAKTYYPVGKVWFLTVRLIYIMHPDDVKILLSDRENITKGSMYDYSEPFIGKGLVTNTGDSYYSRKKLIGPAFNPNSLKKMIRITNKQGKIFIQRLRDAGDETIQNPKLILPRVILNAICEWSMGIDLRNIDKATTEYQHAVETITETVTYRTFRPYLTNWMMKFLEAGRRQDQAAKVANSFIGKIINDRRIYHMSSDYKHLVADETGVKDSLETNELKELHENYCLMDLLLSAERSGLINEKGTLEEIQTIVAAGFDTSATVLSFLLVLLAENKVAQDLARSEALRTLEKYGNELTVEHLNELDYIERCIKESMRIFPAVPFLVRNLQKDMRIRNYNLPVGSEVGILVYSLHRNPEFWPNPEQFDPDRFLPEQVKTRHPFAYLPFSAGVRGCIGRKFAMAQMKVLIATILSNFQLESIDKSNDITFEMNFVLTPTRPFHVKFIKLHTKY